MNAKAEYIVTHIGRDITLAHLKKRFKPIMVNGPVHGGAKMLSMAEAVSTK